MTCLHRSIGLLCMSVLAVACLNTGDGGTGGKMDTGGDGGTGGKTDTGTETDVVCCECTCFVIINSTTGEEEVRTIMAQGKNINCEPECRSQCNLLNWETRYFVEVDCFDGSVLDTGERDTGG